MTRTAKRWFSALVATALLGLAPGGRSMAQRPKAGPAFRSGDPIVATTYFYWYDVNPADGPPKKGYTNHPTSWDDFTWRSVSWHKRQLADMEEAGIDVVLPNYWGHPGIADRPDDPVYWVYGGLRTLVQARDELVREGRNPPWIGMFYDTTTLTTLDANDTPRLADDSKDLTTDAGKDWSYRSVSSFFRIVPERHRALVDGKPVIFLYMITFARDVDAGYFPYLQGRFEKEFGKRLFLVKDREDFGGTHAHDPGVLLWRDRVLRGELTETQVLAELVASDEFYRRSGGTPQRFADRVARDVFGGRAPPDPPAADLETLGGRQAWADAALSGPAREAYNRRALADLYKLWLGRTEPLDGLAADMANGVFLDREMSEWLRALNAGEAPVNVRAAVAASPAFLAKAGNTTEGFIRRLYETVLWRSARREEVDFWADKINRQLAASGQADLTTAPQVRGDAAAEFVATPEATALIVARWYGEHLGRRPGWPGHADSVYNWLGSVTPGYFEVTSIGPGYDDSRAPGLRKPVRVSRRGGRLYAENWETLLAMRPRPWIAHIETWNEYHEATNIAECLEYGRKYLDMTRDYAARFHAR